MMQQPPKVRTHIRNIYDKLDVCSKTDAVMKALRLGWLRIALSTDGAITRAKDRIHRHDHLDAEISAGASRLSART
jgi:hypothetical protein